MIAMSVTFDFSQLLKESIPIDGNEHIARRIESVSMIGMRLSKDNLEFVKKLTSEGMNEPERKSHVMRLSETAGCDVFEFSTCNRVLFVGFDCSLSHLKNSVLTNSGLDYAPFDSFKGMEAWRHLVKICSGLDSFIIGELQVMSQFRDAIAWHKETKLLSVHNATFLDHAVAANRGVRKELGFTKTPESMLSLGTSAIREAISEDNQGSITVIGYGSMGRKAVEILIALGQKNIHVVTRSKGESAKRTPELVDLINFKTFEEWKGEESPTIVISTIRNTFPTFNRENPLPVPETTKVMDFSWPPSIDRSGLSTEQRLMDMEYWIRSAHKLGKEWEYEKTIDSGNLIIAAIEERFMKALNGRTQSRFRGHVYSTLESKSQDWGALECRSSEASQMKAFSREIATWICNQDSIFNENDLQNMVMNTDRDINSDLLSEISFDVMREMVRMSNLDTLMGAAA